MNNQRVILVFADWYEPGFKAGGPIRSCVNFAREMKSDYEVFVFTRDRDLGDDKPYSHITADKWIELEENLNIFYASPGFLGGKNLLALVNEVRPGFIYLNSMFSTFFSIYPLMFKYLGKIDCKVILAPRGMLKESALGVKPVKKKLFLFLLKAIRIFRKIEFHATDAGEVTEIKKQFGQNTKVTFISNFPGNRLSFEHPPRKEGGELSMIYVGRIHPIKNLSFLLKCMMTLKEEIGLTIVGAVEDEKYWLSCKEILQAFPPNLRVNVCGNIPHGDVEALIKKHHIFVLPTKGENYGHAIVEALSTGRPVLISDQTPWRNLETQQAGWDLPLEKQELFTAAIHRAAIMSYEELLVWCQHAWRYSQNIISHAEIKAGYLKLFN